MGLRSHGLADVHASVEVCGIAGSNDSWALDFMHDALFSGQRFRTLNVLDEGVRECLGIEVDTSLTSLRVVRVLDQIASWRASSTSSG